MRLFSAFAGEGLDRNRFGTMRDEAAGFLSGVAWVGALGLCQSFMRARRSDYCTEALPLCLLGTVWTVRRVPTMHGRQQPLRLPAPYFRGPDAGLELPVEEQNAVSVGQKCRSCAGSGR